MQSDRLPPPRRFDLDELLPIHLGLEGKSETHSEEQSHAESLNVSTPVYKHAVQVLKTTQRLAPTWIEPAAPYSAYPPLGAALDVVLGALSSEVRHVWLYPHHTYASSVADAALNEYLQARIANLEREVQTISQTLAAITQRAAPKARHFSIPISRLVKQVEDYLPAIETAFCEAFGVEPAITVKKRPNEEDFPVLICIDVASADPDKVAAARESGARGTFYRTLGQSMPSDLLDMSRFEFSFPT